MFFGPQTLDLQVPLVDGMTIEDGRRVRDRWVLAFIKAITAVRKSYRGEIREKDETGAIKKDQIPVPAVSKENISGRQEAGVAEESPLPPPATPPVTEMRRESISDLD